MTADGNVTPVRSKTGRRILFFLVGLVAAVAVGSAFAFFVLNQTNSHREKAVAKITNIVQDIEQVVQDNDIAPDSVISGTVQDAPVQGQIIDSETRKTYLFSLPPFGKAALISAKPYIAVEGTVTDYTVTYFNEDAGGTIVYTRSDDSLVIRDNE